MENWRDFDASKRIVVRPGITHNMPETKKYTKPNVIITKDMIINLVIELNIKDSEEFIKGL